MNIKFRRGPQSNVANAETIYGGEPIFSYDTHRFYIGTDFNNTTHSPVTGSHKIEVATIGNGTLLSSGAKYAGWDNEGHIIYTNVSYTDLTNKPTIPTVHDGILTVQGTGILSGTGTFSANDSQNKTISIAHNIRTEQDGTTTSSTATPGSEFTIPVYTYTYDTYGHETQKTLHNYKLTIPSVTGAMHFIGVANATGDTTFTEGMTTNPVRVGGVNITAVSGDVVVQNDFEYVFDGNVWHKLGDDSSYALKDNVVNSITASGDNWISATPTIATKGDVPLSLTHSNPNTGASHPATSGGSTIEGGGFVLTGVSYDAKGHMTGITSGTLANFLTSHANTYGAISVKAQSTGTNNYPGLSSEVTVRASKSSDRLNFNTQNKWIVVKADPDASADLDAINFAHTAPGTATGTSEPITSGETTVITGIKTDNAQHVTGYTYGILPLYPSFTDHNQKIGVGNTEFGADDVVKLTQGTNVTIAADPTQKTITFSANDTTYTIGTTTTVSSSSAEISTILNSSSGRSTHTSFTLTAGENVTFTDSANGLTINATDTVYTHPTYSGSGTTETFSSAGSLISQLTLSNGHVSSYKYITEIDGGTF